VFLGGGWSVLGLALCLCARSRVWLASMLVLRSASGASECSDIRRSALYVLSKLSLTLGSFLPFQIPKAHAAPCARTRRPRRFRVPLNASVGPGVHLVYDQSSPPVAFLASFCLSSHTTTPACISHVLSCRPRLAFAHPVSSSLQSPFP